MHTKVRVPSVGDWVTGRVVGSDFSVLKSGMRAEACWPVNSPKVSLALAFFFLFVLFLKELDQRFRSFQEMLFSMRLGSLLVPVDDRLV